jgi:TPP-dependent pyruvate/acetoin dehydrogenase alpha subunit
MQRMLLHPKQSQEHLELYRRLFLIRRAEEKVREEYSKDKMKTPVHLSVGQEAIAVGVCHALSKDAKVFGTYRSHALYLAMTEDTDGFFAELYGKVTGPARGKAGSMHLAAPARGFIATSAVVASTIPLAVGAALAQAYRGSSAVVAVFLGDGALEEGSFWESLNFTCLKKLRVLFVCEDNGLAIHSPRSGRQGFRSILEVLKGFKCDTLQGDGSDLSFCVSATRQLLKQMTDEPRPAFLHLNCVRLLEHVGIGEDFDAGYRRRPSSEEGAFLDPLRRFENELRQGGVTNNLLTQIQEKDVLA